jgi:hypothetical protein
MIIRKLYDTTNSESSETSDGIKIFENEVSDTSAVGLKNLKPSLNHLFQY